MAHLLVGAYQLMMQSEVDPSPQNWAARLERADAAHVEFFKNASTEITLNSLKPNEQIPQEIHAKQDQIILVVVGALRVVRWKDATSNAVDVTAGGSVVINAGVVHELTATDSSGPTKFFSIYANK